MAAKVRHEKKRKSEKARGREDFPLLPYECSWAYEQAFRDKKLAGMLGFKRMSEMKNNLSERSARVQSFIEEVDRVVRSIAGVSVHDLPDADFSSMMEDDYSPEEAAREILENEGF